MTIGIDASRANKDKKTGTEWYSWHIIEELKKITPQDVRVVLYSNEKLKGALGNCPPNFSEKILAWPPKYLWTQIRLWWELLIRPPDVLFVPAHTIPFLFIRKKTRVTVTVHDVGFARFPKLYKKIQYWYHHLTMLKIRGRADLIITISEFSKKEIVELYGVRPEKIKIIYLGFDRERYQPADEAARGEEKEFLKEYGVDSPYIFYAGRLEKKKNIGNLVKAFALAKAEHPELKLVLAGSAGNEFETIKKIIADFRLEKEIIFLNYVDGKDLPALYRGAEAFVFATLYEGFGLPMIEAMACGAPLVASDLPIHREIAGEAAIFADPFSPQAMAEAILRLMSDNDLRQSLVEKGFKRAKEFSWQKTAAETFSVLSGR